MLSTLSSAVSVILSRTTLNFLTATGTTTPQGTDEIVTHPMSFVPRSGGSSDPFVAEPSESILLTVMSSVIPETGDEGREVGEDEVEPQDGPPVPAENA